MNVNERSQYLAGVHPAERFVTFFLLKRMTNIDRARSRSRAYVTQTRVHVRTHTHGRRSHTHTHMRARARARLGYRLFSLITSGRRCLLHYLSSATGASY